MKEKVLIDEKPSELEVQPYTVVFNSTHKEINYPERTMITPEMTLKHFQEMQEPNIFEECFFRFVINDYKDKFDKKTLENSNMGVKHITGLVSLTLNYFLKNKQFGWKYPESFVHPKYQGNIADLLILLNNKSMFVRFIENIKNGKLLNCEDVHYKFFKVICCENLKDFVK